MIDKITDQLSNLTDSEFESNNDIIHKLID